jgi:Methylamine utilisation protein MauE
MIALLLSAVFLAAVTAKLLDLWAFRLTVRELIPFVSRMLAHVLAVAVIVAELLVAVLFIAGSRPLGVAAAAGTCALAMAFVAAFILSRRAPRPVPCRCFGLFGGAVLSARTVMTAGILIAAAAVWTESSGNLATFSSYSFRLLALVPALLILVTSRRPGRGGLPARSVPQPVPRIASIEMDGTRK